MDSDDDHEFAKQGGEQLELGEDFDDDEDEVDDDEEDEEEQMNMQMQQ